MKRYRVLSVYLDWMSSGETLPSADEASLLRLKSQDDPIVIQRARDGRITPEGSDPGIRGLAEACHEVMGRRERHCSRAELTDGHVSRSPEAGETGRDEASISRVEEAGKWWNWAAGSHDVS